MRSWLVIAGCAGLAGCASLAPASRARMVVQVPAPAPAPALAGRIADVAGAPVVGATIILDAPGSPYAITAEDGSFSIGPVPPGRWPLAVYYGDDTSRFGPLVLGDSTQTRVAITLDLPSEPRSDPPNRVEASVPTIDTSSTNQGIIIRSSELTRLPQ